MTNNTTITELAERVAEHSEKLSEDDHTDQIVAEVLRSRLEELTGSRSGDEAVAAKQAELKQKFGLTDSETSEELEARSEAAKRQAELREKFRSRR